MAELKFSSYLDRCSARFPDNEKLATLRKRLSSKLKIPGTSNAPGLSNSRQILDNRDVSMFLVSDLARVESRESLSYKRNSNRHRCDSQNSRSDARKFRMKRLVLVRFLPPYRALWKVLVQTNLWYCPSIVFSLANLDYSTSISVTKRRSRTKIRASLDLSETLERHDHSPNLTPPTICLQPARQMTIGLRRCQTNPHRRIPRLPRRRSANSSKTES